MAQAAGLLIGALGLLGTYLAYEYGPSADEQRTHGCTLREIGLKHGVDSKILPKCIETTSGPVRAPAQSAQPSASGPAARPGNGDRRCRSSPTTVNVMIGSGDCAEYAGSFAPNAVSRLLARRGIEPTTSPGDVTLHISCNFSRGSEYLAPTRATVSLSATCSSDGSAFPPLSVNAEGFSERQDPMQPMGKQQRELALARALENLDQRLPKELISR